MARPLRIEFPGALYHITSRGNARQNIFPAQDDFSGFITILCKVIKRYHLILHFYCLMHNHYHLLIETPEGNLSRGMRQLNGVYTQYINQKYHRAGHLFQGRYKSILVDKENYLLALSRYIALNPFRAKLVDDPKDWPWSSYPQYIGLQKTIACLSTDWLLAQFSPQRRDAMKAYQEFVLSGMNLESPFKRVKGQIFLGSDTFIKKMEQFIEEQDRLAEIPKKQRYATRPSLDALFQKEEQQDRKIYQACQEYGYTLKEIAAYLGVHYTTVSKIIKRVENEKN